MAGTAGPVLIVLVVAAAGLAGCTGGGDRDRGQASISVSPPALRHPDTGHLAGGLTGWYASLTDDALTSSGGTLAATQAAQADAHAKLLAFLAAQ